ncbi:hypothetical protein ACFC8N_33550 [Streptomyces sp. NPDC055966]|uniref:hypothetical protein n=1 Tax=Streptomyces sp. NPDC055966 TaxID=3345669 RepID=UPI0035D9B339
MAEADQLAKLHGAAEADQALGTAAPARRLTENDLISILDHHIGRRVPEPTRPSRGHSLQPGTSASPRCAVAPEGEGTSDGHRSS